MKEWSLYCSSLHNNSYLPIVQPMAKIDSEFVEIDWRQRPVRIEHAWLSPERVGAPLIVFLHEGLGSLAMWKDFPQQLCDATGLRGLVYSRPGYGRSTPRASDEIWRNDFMHQQALEVLPALFQALAVDTRAQPPWFYGHSDGGSMALLYAAHFPDALAGAVVAAPHILVEDLSVSSIELARQAYLETDLRARLAKYHDEPDSPFWGWNRIWLDPAFRAWSIEAEIASIRCPLLALQGRDDEYGTLRQIHGIAERLPQTELLELADCAHLPHRDQPEKVIKAVTQFIHNHNRGDIS
jgi:pimeloyl-ACP methyl ester carboxylesterase